jgi:phosphoribosylaminoimidazole-succinocarboxamide synthase
MELAQGKTKIILQVLGHPNLVIILSKSDLTKGDGAVRIELEGKAEWANITTCRAFELMGLKGIPTHYIGQLDATSFLGYWLDMFPFEFVIRRYAEGSVLERNPKLFKGYEFKQLLFEIFYKDDTKHDPIVVKADDWWDLHDAHQPITVKSRMEPLPRDITFMPTKEEFELMKEYSIEAFLALEEALLKIGIRIKDLKLEGGRDKKGKVRIGDVADNDSWRIELILTEEEMSKESFRKEKDITDAVVTSLKGKYKRVAEAMGKAVPEQSKIYIYKAN